MSSLDGPPPLVSIVAPSRNNAPVLDAFLESLEARTTYPSFELIVADDGSTDRSVEILRRWRDAGRFARFELIEGEHRESSRP